MDRVAAVSASNEDRKVSRGKERTKCPVVNFD